MPPPPTRPRCKWIGGDRSRRLEELGPSSLAGVSYLRRAPRSNELFFVCAEVTVRPTIDAFLAAWHIESVTITHRPGSRSIVCVLKKKA